MILHDGTVDSEAECERLVSACAAYLFLSRKAAGHKPAACKCGDCNSWRALGRAHQHLLRRLNRDDQARSAASASPVV